MDREWLPVPLAPESAGTDVCTTDEDGQRWHRVTVGDSFRLISMLYNVPVGTLYTLNPTLRAYNSNLERYTQAVRLPPISSSNGPEEIMASAYRDVRKQPVTGVTEALKGLAQEFYLTEDYVRFLKEHNHGDIIKIRQLCAWSRDMLSGHDDWTADTEDTLKAYLLMNEMNMKSARQQALGDNEWESSIANRPRPSDGNLWSRWHTDREAEATKRDHLMNEQNVHSGIVANLQPIQEGIRDQELGEIRRRRDNTIGKRYGSSD